MMWCKENLPKINEGLILLVQDNRVTISKRKILDQAHLLQDILPPFVNHLPDLWAFLAASQQMFSYKSSFFWKKDFKNDFQITFLEIFPEHTF